MADNVIQSGPIGGPFPPNEPVFYQIPVVQEFFQDTLNSTKDDDIKKVASAVYVIKQKIMKPEEPLTTEEITHIADGGVSAVKVAYKAGTGKLDPTEATDYLIDRGTSILGTGVKTICERVGEKAGEVAGRYIGKIFGPAGAAVGAKIGSTVGRYAGKVVGEIIIPGIKKIAEVAKNVIQSAWEGVKSVASTVWEGVKSAASSVWEGITSFFGF